MPLCVSELFCYIPIWQGIMYNISYIISYVILDHCIASHIYISYIFNKYIKSQVGEMINIFHYGAHPIIQKNIVFFVFVFKFN